MKARGFDFVLSEEDTGTGDRIHTNAASTEWWVAFHKEAKVGLASDLTHGSLGAQRANNSDYERVPYAIDERRVPPHEHESPVPEALRSRSVRPRALVGGGHGLRLRGRELG